MSGNTTGSGALKVAPFYTANLGSGTLRFFLSQEEGERFPCPCLDDIIASARMSRKDRRFAHVILREKEFPTQIVATTDGLARISSMTMANSFVAGLVHLQRVDVAFETSYQLVCFAALTAMLPRMSEDERMNYVIAARRNEDGISGPHPTMGAVS